MIDIINTLGGTIFRSTENAEPMTTDEQKIGTIVQRNDGPAICWRGSWRATHARQGFFEIHDIRGRTCCGNTIFRTIEDAEKYALGFREWLLAVCEKVNEERLNDITVSVAEHDLENLIEAYHTLSDKADTLKAVNEEANAEVMEFAAGIMGQMLMRLEATGKISGPCLYSPEFTIN